MNASAAFLLLAVIHTPGIGQESLVDWTMRHEGFAEFPYKDTLGHWTQGYGHRVTDFRMEHFQTTQVEAKRTLLADLQTAQTGAARVFPEVETYPTPVKFVLVALTFQIGSHGLQKFVKFGAALRASNYPLAASELRNSVLGKQCPRRTSELAAILETAEGEK